MKRKVLKVGNASLAVSLPSKWVKQHRIKQGEEIDLSEKDGGLFISAEEATADRTITLEVPETNQFARRAILSPYIQGYDCIIINYKEPATRKRIDDALQYITGFEIVDERRGQVTLKNVAHGIEGEFNVLFRRMFHLVNTMSELLVEAVEKNDISIFDELDTYEHTLSKLQNFCRRILNTQPHMDLKHVTAAYRVSSELECIGDIITFISKHLRKLKRMPEIKEGTVRVAKLLSIMTEAYFSSSLPLISRHSKETRATEEWLEENAMRADPSTYFKLAEICHLIREITIEVIYPFEN